MVKSLTVSLAVGLALIAATASAQRRDTAGERQLVTTEMTIDANAADAGSGRVTGKIVEQWAGTQFKFDDTTTREVTAEDVQAFRAKGVGYGGISILLALAANQDGANPQSLEQILAMRQTEKMGWGNIAKALGYDSLGEVVRSVKAADASVRSEARGGGAKSERSVRAERMDRPEKADKPEKVEKMNRPERVERIERKSK